jgi:hypothetical protein
MSNSIHGWILNNFQKSKTIYPISARVLKHHCEMETGRDCKHQQFVDEMKLAGFTAIGDGRDYFFLIENKSSDPTDLNC